MRLINRETQVERDALMRRRGFSSDWGEVGLWTAGAQNTYKQQQCALL